MRNIFIAAAIVTAISGPVAASSLTTPQGSGSTPSPSIIYLGEAGSPDRHVDPTATASVATDPAADVLAAAAAAQKQADLEWAQFSAAGSPSIIFYGKPLPAAKAPAAEIAAFDPNQLPMVMRGGIEGDALPAPSTTVEATATPADTGTNEAQSTPAP